MEARDMANFEKALTFAFDQFDKVGMLIKLEFLYRL